MCWWNWFRIYIGRPEWRVVWSSGHESLVSRSFIHRRFSCDAFVHSFLCLQLNSKSATGLAGQNDHRQLAISRWGKQVTFLAI
ncbi:hypothetical protein M514_01825 [Trichuris suis]|uniref:Uncharacterized protein n=1 Tax=Trichuris suis TaxID=68888 RepID=A0A085MJB8_9BILA|nr:hypothetical protein M513_01825 [Trichuris suis]KFD72699.1 hypothetical protein M514_01825 [Trichuris suis]